ncbi:uncharacterized protein [Diabrotica undecimpunctata]|uniref:uncharacterized protein n=1 Tax=Diabrotica undecimpunctata TaxID=50387 RepID=UPI003B632091
MLIGSDLFWDILRNGKISLGKNLPVLQNTCFGYVLAGLWSQNVDKVQCFFVQSDQVQKDLEKFWSIEEVSNTKVISQEDNICEEHFNTYSKDSTGKFIVKITLKESREQLGDSKDLAVRRLLNLERQFEKDIKLKKLYVSFMQEYQALNHMSIYTYFDDNICSYFLPHHGVLRNESLSTRLRVVFNGSANTTTGKSLNSIQYAGPAIQNDIFAILLRFRFHKYVVISDIEKMYRCIDVHPDDRH